MVAMGADAGGLNGTGARAMAVVSWLKVSLSSVSAADVVTCSPEAGRSYRLFRRTGPKP
jgi:hypothetical protein